MGVGESISPLYYGFICPEKKIMFLIYFGILLVGLVGAGIITTVQTVPAPTLNAIAWFIAGLTGLPGFIHLHHYQDRHMDPRFTILPWINGCIFFFIGALIYSLRIPERYYPRTFDFLGSSHQIMHVLTMVGMAIHINASLTMYHNAMDF